MRGHFVIVGIALAIWQIVTVRELYPILHACDPLIVASLGVTAICLGLGILLGPSAEVPRSRRIGPFGAVLWAAGFLPPVQLGFLRLLADWGASSPPSLMKALILSALAIGPLAVDAGLLVTIFGAGGQRANSYLHEALVLLGTGAILGGVGYSVVLSGLMPPLLTALCLSLFLFTGVLLLFARRDTPGLLLLPGVLSWIAAVVAIVALNSPIREALVRPSAGPRGPEAVGTQGAIETDPGERELDVFLNGICVTPRSATDEVAHLPLLQHFLPQKVLVIGGEGPELLGEILRHNVQSVRYFHLDPAVVAMMLKHAPARAVFRAAAVELQSPLEDARAYVQEGGDAFDVVLVDVPLPQGVGMNRFLTAEFFSALRRVVKEGGFAAVTLRLPDKPSPEMLRLAGSILKAFAASFPEYIVSVGKVHMLIGAASGVGPTISPEELRGRCVERNLAVDAFGAPRLVRGAAPTKPGGENSDLKPALLPRCFDAWVGAKRAHFALTNIGVAVGVAAVAIYVLSMIVGKKHLAAACGGVLFGGMAAGMLFASELLVLQAVYGSLYRHIAFMLAVLAIGLCAGLAISGAMGFMRQGRHVALAAALGMLMVTALLMPGVFRRVSSVGDGAWWLAHLRLTLPFLGGVVGFFFAFAFGIAGMMARLPEVLFLALLGTGLGLLLGSIVLAPANGLAAPCEAAVILSCFGAGIAIISMP